MTSKERAIELINRFEHQYNLDISEDIGIRGIDYEMAKQCALITIQYCLETSKYMPLTLKYWEEVKKEIENI
jgi:hypothetical protein